MPATDDKNSFITVKDGTKIYTYTYLPETRSRTSIYIISGITGINHRTEFDIIQQLSSGKNRIIVIHPRGTGYSEGTRGDINDFNTFINDYKEIISSDIRNLPEGSKAILYGHSMSSAIALKIAESLPGISGIILVNPPYKMKNAKGMTPAFSDYVRYAGYMIFAPHSPVVNMSGDPNTISNPDDRRESEERSNDPLLVKYFSMYYMLEAKKLMDKMVEMARTANFPLLLVYGSNDAIVDQKGCDELFENWKSKKRKYEIIENGSHGKTTVKSAMNTIHAWLEDL